MRSILFGIGWVSACAAVGAALCLIDNHRQYRGVSRRIKSRRVLGRAMVEQWATWRNN